jgi:hypothetical protein
MVELYRDMKNKFLIVVHLLLVILAYTAWVWLDWRILAVFAIAHLIMLEVLSGCPLSHAQFPEDKEKRFYEWWMAKLGIKLTTVKRRRRMRIFMQYILPFVIVGLALLLQTVLGTKAVLSLPF